MSFESSSDKSVYVESTFEKITFEREIPFSDSVHFQSNEHYIVQWVVLSSVMFVFGVVLLYFLNDGETYYTTILSLTCNISLWPGLCIYFSKKFYDLWSKCLFVLYWDNLDIAREWYQESAKKIFVFNTLLRKWPIILWLAIVIEIVFRLPEPFPHNNFLNNLLILTMLFIFFIAVWSVHILASLIWVLGKISKLTPKLDYFSSGHIYYKKIKDFYVEMTRLVFYEVILMFIGFISSPYTQSKTLPDDLIVWIFVTTLISIIVCFLVIHYLKIIQMNLKKITIQKIEINAEDLKNSLDTKKYLYNFSFDDTKIKDFLFACMPLLTAIMQIVITYMRGVLK